MAVYGAPAPFGPVNITEHCELCRWRGCCDGKGVRRRQPHLISFEASSHVLALMVCPHCDEVGDRANVWRPQFRHG